MRKESSQPLRNQFRVEINSEIQWRQSVPIWILRNGENIGFSHRDNTVSEIQKSMRERKNNVTMLYTMFFCLYAFSVFYIFCMVNIYIFVSKKNIYETSKEIV